MMIGAPISPHVLRFLRRDIVDAISPETAHLFAHQREALVRIRYLVREYGGAWLRLGLGGGKTCIAITWASEYKRALIICPKTLIPTWEAEIKKHAKKSYIVISWDAQKSKTQKWGRAYADALRSPWVFFIVNAEAFSAKNTILEKYLLSFGADCVAIDESSKIKSADAQRTKNILKFIRGIPARVAMTGTEITQSPLDVFAQSEFVCRRFLGYTSFWLFRNDHTITQKRYTAGGAKSFDEIVGYKNIPALIEKLGNISYVKRTEDCIDLPPKTYMTIPIELSAEEKKAYAEIKNDLMTQLSSGVFTVETKIAAFTKLRQITGGTVLTESGLHQFENPAKLSATVDELEDVSEQVVIFAAFRGEIAMLKNNLDAVTFYGDDSADAKRDALEQFQAGKVQCFIAHPASGGYGLNLQNSRALYWYSLPTSLGDHIQAEGRIYRSGQTRPCIYKSLVATGTIDERIAELLAGKAEILKEFRSWGAKEIEKL